MTFPDEAVQAMPERIYAVKQTEGSNCVVSFDTPSLDYNVEYVRADLADPFMQGLGVLDDATMQKLREALRFSASRSVMSSADEQRILSAIYIGIPISAPSPRAQALEELPCDVQLPGVKLGRGVKFSVLLTALKNRESWPDADRSLSSQPVADGWVPIETAPKDGTHILVYCSRMKEVGEAKWCSESFNGHGPTWVIAGFNQAWASNPTHWRPLPASPGASE